MEFGDQWSDEQSALVEVVIGAFRTTFRWPVFQYVQSELRRQGHNDVVRILDSFPTLGTRAPTSYSYSDVRFDHIHPAPPLDSEVALSVSGMSRHPAGEEVAEAFVACLRIAARKYRQTPMNPTQVVSVIMLSSELGAEPGVWWPDYLVREVGLLFRSESPAGVSFGGGAPDGTSWRLSVDQDALDWEEATVASYLESIKQRTKLVAAVTPSFRSRSDSGGEGQVFIVHGHDSATKHHVARVVRKLTNRDPIILDEQASRGRTIIEKFEDEGGSAAFAIVLLTPDDMGAAEGEEPKPRARQNVVFELGYFVGHLGRSRVVALTGADLELPSDYAGVVYISLDVADWETRLAREMRLVEGLDVDLNRLFS